MNDENLSDLESQYLEYEKNRMQVFSEHKVVKSDAYCVLSGAPYKNVPLIINRYCEIEEAPSDWLRFLLTSNSGELTVFQYASGLCSFFTYLSNVAHVEWENVSDKNLREWRNRMRIGSTDYPKLKRKSINAKLNIIVRFYLWAQEHQYIFDVIGLTKDGCAPYPIRLVPHRGRQNQKRPISQLLFKTPRKPRRPIPTQGQMDDLMIALSGPSLEAERNVLIAQWAVGSGLRRAEIINLNSSELPSPEECSCLVEADKMHWMHITGKGGKEREVPVDPEIIFQSQQFLDRRNDYWIKNKIPANRRGKASYEKIFVNLRTGNSLNLQYVSRIISQAFQKDVPNKEKRPTLHRLRARFLSKLVQVLAQAAIDEGRDFNDSVVQRLILEQAAVIIGHSDIETLRPYLNLYLDKKDTVVLAASKAARGVPTMGLKS